MNSAPSFADREEFLAAHPDDYIVHSAFGNWHSSVPTGWVGVYARLGNHAATWDMESTHPSKTFLVPREEYHTRKETFGLFAVDPTRHPVWDPDKPSTEQTLSAKAAGDEDNDEMRPSP